MSNKFPGFKQTATTVQDASIWVRQNYMDLANPNPSEIFLRDIARGLARECRFNGHVSHFYSVAEHSVHCVKLFDLHAAGDIYTDPWLRDIAIDILMHDAHEAFLKDQTSPLKGLIAPCYKPLAARMQAAISARFNLSESSPEWVQRVDLEMLAAERLHLMPETEEWPCVKGVKWPEIDILCLDPDEAEHAFLQTAELLGVVEYDAAAHEAV